MIFFIKLPFSWFQKKKTKFPREFKEFWYCGAWHEYSHGMVRGGIDYEQIKNPAVGRPAFKPFGLNLVDSNANRLIDGLIPVIEIDGEIGLYKLSRSQYRLTSFYDGLVWDNGYHIDLEFVKSISLADYEACCTF